MGRYRVVAGPANRLSNGDWPLSLTLTGPADWRSCGYFAHSGELASIALLSLFGALAPPAGQVAIVESLAPTAPLFTTLFVHFLLQDLGIETTPTFAMKNVVQTGELGREVNLNALTVVLGLEQTEYEPE